MPIKLGVKITEKVFHSVVKDLQNLLVSGEEVLFMGLTNNIRPLLKYLFVTINLFGTVFFTKHFQLFYKRAAISKPSILFWFIFNTVFCCLLITN